MAAGVFSVSVWHKGLEVNEVAARLLSEGGSSLDAVEAALRFSEDDTRDGSTGWGGMPNCDGEVELDAAIMLGPGAAAGAVGALKETRYAISVARCVMEQSPHVLLVGDGARKFAREHGFAEFDLLTESSRQRWLEWRAQTRDHHAAFTSLHSAKPATRTEAETHDTMATTAIDSSGVIAAGCTTSGLAFKLPGRVGDSPIIGAGLYADQEVGAAIGTGVGEEALRISLCCIIVEGMRRGLEPTAACEEALQRLLRVKPDNAGKQFGVAALRMDGVAGGACIRQGYGYCSFDGHKNVYIPCEPLVKG